jgi:hypothetical protein
MHISFVAKKSLKMPKGVIRSRYSKYRQCKGKRKQTKRQTMLNKMIRLHLRMSNTNPAKNGANSSTGMVKHFLLYKWNPSCYSCNILTNADLLYLTPRANMFQSINHIVGFINWLWKLLRSHGCHIYHWPCLSF